MYHSFYRSEYFYLNAFYLLEPDLQGDISSCNSTSGFFKTALK